MQQQIFNILLPSILSISLGSFAVFKLARRVSLTQDCYDSAPEYAELDREIGTYTYPSDIKKLIITVIVMVVLFILMAVFNGLKIYSMIEEAPAIKNIAEGMFLGALMIQTGVLCFSFHPITKKISDTKFDFRDVLNTALFGGGWILLLYKGLCAIPQ